MPDYWVDFFKHLSQYSRNWIEVAELFGSPVWQSAVESARNTGVSHMISGGVAAAVALCAFIAAAFSRIKESSGKVIWVFNLWYAAVGFLLTSLAMKLIVLGYDELTNPVVYAFERLLK